MRVSEQKSQVYLEVVLETDTQEAHLNIEVVHGERQDVLSEVICSPISHPEVTDKSRRESKNIS